MVMVCELYGGSNGHGPVCIQPIMDLDTKPSHLMMIQN